MIDFAGDINNPEFLEIIPSYKARFDLINEDLNTALEWARTFPSLNIDIMSIFLWIEVPIITRARILIKHGEENDLKDALNSLDRILEIIQDLHFKCQELDVLLLQALAHYKLQKRDKAYGIMEQAVALGNERKWVRPFVEIGKDLLPILEETNTELPTQVFKESIVNLLKSTTPDKSVLLKQSHSEPIKNMGLINRLSELTQRETEAIKWLAQGLRNKEIADKMCISVGAVKKHLYRSFQKLEAPNRLALIKGLRHLDIHSTEL
jgi:LuxR family maltose regulon positive regulatory protein